MRRVVVTGLGVASPVGIGWQEAWSTIIAGGHGITQMPEEVGNLPSKVAGLVPNFNASEWIEHRQSRLQSTRFIAMGMCAGERGPPSWSPLHLSLLLAICLYEQPN